MADKKPRSDDMTEDESLAPDPVHAEAASEGFFVNLMCQFTTAWLFLTRIPLPRWWNRPELAQEPAAEPEPGEEGDEKGEAASAPDKGRALLPW